MEAAAVSEHGPQWDRDEEYRQSVIRKALLLGFSCRERPLFTHEGRKPGSIEFDFEGTVRVGYASIYSAAYEFLRLSKIPLSVIGDYRG